MEIVLDTNILIEILKNNKQTIKEVEEYDIHHISVITAMELFYGAFNKTELQKLEREQKEIQEKIDKLTGKTNETN